MALCRPLLGNTLVDHVLLHTDIAIAIDEAFMAALRTVLVEVNLLDLLHRRQYLWLFVYLFKSSIMELDKVWWAIRLEVHLDSGKLRAGQLKVRWHHLNAILISIHVFVVNDVVILRRKFDRVTKFALRVPFDRPIQVFYLGIFQVYECLASHVRLDVIQ